MCTVTAITPPGRFGALEIQNRDKVTGFREKIASDQYKINGGFFVVNPEVASFIEDDNSIWEQEPIRKLAEQDQVRAWQHDGFWQPMDTIRDKKHLEKLWESKNPPWIAK